MNRILCITAVLLILNPFLACKRDAHTITVGNWTCIPDNEDSITSVMAKRGWHPYTVSAYVQSILPDPRRRLWIQGDFIITGDPSRYSGLTTGRIRYGDETYVNGELIGFTPEEKSTCNPLKRHYDLSSRMFPRQVLVQGKNTLIMRLDMPRGEFAGMAGDVLIQQEKDYEWSKFIDSFVFVNGPLSIIIFYIISAFSLMTFFIFNRTKLLTLYPVLIDLCIVAYLASMFVPFGAVPMVAIYSLQWGLIPLTCALAILMTQEIMGVYINYINWIITPLLVCASAAILALFRMPAGPVISASILSISFLITLIFIPLYVRRFFANNDDAVTVGMYCAMLAVCMFMIIAEILLYRAGSTASGLVMIYFSPLCILIFHGILSRSYMLKTIEMEKVYDSLKQPGKPARGPQITETSEEKLNRVIDFVNKNYTSDIAREGLAAAVDLHPNYMSRIFKVYTGVKISDYITKLRIQDAAQRLADEQQKIIDIALATGFESLTTFNRSFRKLMGESPTDYRKNCGTGGDN